MKKRLTKLVAALLAAVLCVPMAGAARKKEPDPVWIRVGLASTSSHNATGPLAAAHLQNASEEGEGFRFGYYDEDLEFVELGRTGEDMTEIAVLKTQNLYYGYVPSLDKYTYSDAINSDTAVGCYHIQLPDVYGDWEEALEEAEDWDGFVAWIDGEYRVRLGAYLSRDAAEEAREEMELAPEEYEILGTSAQGMSVVETGTDRILFQFDGGEITTLGIFPDVTGAEDVSTWFSGFKYRGGFAYQRIGGGSLTVVNVVDVEDYVKGVVCYEMGREWPLEALKAQAICARTYVLKNLKNHDSLGFDICNSTGCQVYRGLGSGRENYGPSQVSDEAVEETAGEVLWYEDDLASTFFSSCHGGASESANYIWGTNLEVYPYLCGVEDPYEETVADENPYSSWTKSYTQKELTKRLQSYGYAAKTEVEGLELTYSDLGNVVKVKVCYENGQSNTFTPRTKPSITNLFDVRSIRFTVNGETASGDGGEEIVEEGYLVNGDQVLASLEGLYVISGDGEIGELADKPYVVSGKGKTSKLEPNVFRETSSGTNQGGGTVAVSDDTYTIQGSGWGHQVGLSQYGAYAMAKLDFTYDEIVEFYFPGTQVGPYED